MKAPTVEEIGEYHATMPRLAASHTSEGPFSLLDTNPLFYPAQLIDQGFIPAYDPARRELQLAECVGIASTFASNLGEIALELYDKQGEFLDILESKRYQDSKAIVLVGDHDSFDNIVYPDMAIAAAEEMRHPATDVPENRTLIMAKQLAWYGLGAEPVTDLLLNYANVALTAPGTISGRETADTIRKYLNSRSVPEIQASLANGRATITFAYAGQTNRKLVNPITDEVALNIQYTPSDGSLGFMTHPNVTVIPFATHRDETTKRMTFAYGEPREIASIEEGRELGNEIAYLSWLISGVHTIQAIDRKQFDILTDSSRDPSHLRNLGKIVRKFIQTNRTRYHYDDSHAYYIVGSRNQLATEKPD